MLLTTLVDVDSGNTLTNDLNAPNVPFAAIRVKT